MCFLPSFLRFWGPSVTRIRESSYHRMAAARSLSTVVVSPAAASHWGPARVQVQDRQQVPRRLDQRLLDAITCEWKCADPWKPRAEATGGKANVAHLSCCQQLLLKNSAVHGHPQVVRLVSVCGMGQHQLSRLQRTPVLSTTACQVPPWWPRQGQRQKARTKVGTARGGSQWTIPHPTYVSNSVACSSCLYHGCATVVNSDAT